MLVHVVELAPVEGEPWANHEAVRSELASYGAGLDRLPELVVLSKRDLLEPEAVAREVTAWSERLGDAVLGVTAVSSATGEGIDELHRRILSGLPEDAPARPGPSPEPSAFEAEHRVYRPLGEGGYWIEREEDGAFRVTGRGVEMLFERHDLANEEALAYLEQRLKEIGVVAALRSAGFRPGDEVRVGENEFELHP